MKFVIVFVAYCLLGAFAAVIKEHEFIDWHHIKPLGLHVEPIGPAPEYIGTRISGGSIAPPNSFPYQVALIINVVSFCGGSIISRDWVLTAAHCVCDISSNTPVQVIAGAHNPSVNEPSQVRIAAVSVVVHSGWDISRLENDIAVLRVPNIPIGTQAIDSVGLAPLNSGTFAGSQAELSGWGRTSDNSSMASELRNITLPIITNQVCQSAYFGSYVRATNICTSGAGGVGSCDGDSGGPLVVDGAQVGVVSFGSLDCGDGSPSVFARVSSYRTWIQQQTGL